MMPLTVNAVKSVLWATGRGAAGVIATAAGPATGGVWSNAAVDEEDTACVLELRDLYGSPAEADDVQLEISVTAASPQSFPTSCVLSLSSAKGPSDSDIVVKDWALPRGQLSNRGATFTTTLGLRTLVNIAGLVTGGAPGPLHLGVCFVGCCDNTRRHAITQVGVLFVVQHPAMRAASASAVSQSPPPMAQPSMAPPLAVDLHRSRRPVPEPASPDVYVEADHSAVEVHLDISMDSPTRVPPPAERTLLPHTPGTETAVSMSPPAPHYLHFDAEVPDVMATAPTPTYRAPPPRPVSHQAEPDSTIVLALTPTPERPKATPSPSDAVITLSPSPGPADLRAGPDAPTTALPSIYDVGTPLASAPPSAPQTPKVPARRAPMPPSAFPATDRSSTIPPVPRVGVLPSPRPSASTTTTALEDLALATPSPAEEASPAWREDEDTSRLPVEGDNTVQRRSLLEERLTQLERRSISTERLHCLTGQLSQLAREVSSAVSPRKEQQAESVETASDGSPTLAPKALLGDESPAPRLPLPTELRHDAPGPTPTPTTEVPRPRAPSSASTEEHGSLEPTQETAAPSPRAPSEPPQAAHSAPPLPLRHEGAPRRWIQTPTLPRPTAPHRRILTPALPEAPTAAVPPAFSLSGDSGASDLLDSRPAPTAHQPDVASTPFPWLRGAASGPALSEAHTLLQQHRVATATGGATAVAALAPLTAPAQVPSLASFSVVSRTASSVPVSLADTSRSGSAMPAMPQSSYRPRGADPALALIAEATSVLGQFGSRPSSLQGSRCGTPTDHACEEPQHPVGAPSVPVTPAPATPAPVLSVPVTDAEGTPAGVSTEHVIALSDGTHSAARSNSATSRFTAPQRSPSVLQPRPLNVARNALDKSSAPRPAPRVDYPVYAWCEKHHRTRGGTARRVLIIAPQRPAEGGTKDSWTFTLCKTDPRHWPVGGSPRLDAKAAAASAGAQHTTCAVLPHEVDAVAGHDAFRDAAIHDADVTAAERCVVVRERYGQRSIIVAVEVSSPAEMAAVTAALGALHA